MKTNADESAIGVERIVSRCARFLDRWFEPRWRALLTWVIVSRVSGWAFEAGAFSMIDGACEFAFTELAEVLPIATPRGLYGIWAMTTVVILLFWIQPVALRLGCWRSLLWLGSLGIFPVSIRLVPFYLIDYIGYIGLALTAVGVFGSLYGCRTRPWLAIPAVGIVILTMLFTFLQKLPFWWVFTGTNFICGSILLYGTRLIEPPASSADSPDPRDS